MSDDYLNPELMHYGILRESGRYPWGSGKDEYGRSMEFYGYVDHLKSKGLSEVQIAQGVGMSVADLRSTRTIAKEQIVYEETHQAVKLRNKGMSIEAIAKQLDMPQPTVRLRLKNSEKKQKSSLRETADVIRGNVDKHGIVDVGKGTEHSLGIRDTRMKAALSVLRDEGYETYNLQTPNVGTNHFTNQRVIVPPGTGFGAAKRMTDRIHTMGEWSEDGGLTYFGIHEPVSISSKRLKVNFKEDGGGDADGIVYVRPGVKDLDMGKNNYAQVRIKIDGTHYIKGVAIIKDDLPDGVDLLFNTPKPASTGKLGALKELKEDPSNPFGSQIKRQILETGKDGVERAKSAINLVNEEGDWDDWRVSLPSQMLSKQPHPLIKSQLKETRTQVESRLADINKITNAVVRKKALEDYAAQIDSDAVDLRAAAMPRQRTQLLLPIKSMAKNEIYAPNFETGERVVLVRFPHGGRFEIPEVTVNNNSRTAKKLLGNATDAIGVHPSVATRLSGADFDGDTVLVIPNRQGSIKGAKSMGSQAKIFDDGLGDFDAKESYGGYQVIRPAVGKPGEPGYKAEVGTFKLMKNTGKEMGMVTNLITDMSIQGAKPEHVVRAVRHSQVVIDAEKHKLDYKRSEVENGIKQLRDLYQTRVDTDGSIKVGGATTLLSRATAEDRVPERKLRSAKSGGPIDPVTGAVRYEETGRTNSKYDPKTQTYSTERVPVTKGVRRLALTDDAYTLVRDGADPVEKLYADHVNEMKSLANKARLTSARTPDPPTNKAAKVVYKAELDKLVHDLRAAEAQKPLDRRADVLARSTVIAKRQDDPTLRTDRERLKKVERQAKEGARARLGLTRPVIEITDTQWDAIQAGVVSPSRLRSILLYADPVRVSELSMPRANTVVTSAVVARAKNMLAAGATTADVASALGISASTLKSAALRGDLE